MKSLSDNLSNDVNSGICELETCSFEFTTIDNFFVIPFAQIVS